MNYKRNHNIIGLSFALALISSLNCQAQFLPTPTQEAKPGVRWWWMGSAVDQENLKWNLGEYAKAGIGAVEITPLYGVKVTTRMISLISRQNGWICSSSWKRKTGRWASKPIWLQVQDGLSEVLGCLSAKRHARRCS